MKVQEARQDARLPLAQRPRKRAAKTAPRAKPKGSSGTWLTEHSWSGSLASPRFISRRSARRPLGGAQLPLLGGLLPGPPPLGSLEALGWRGILWLGPSRPPRSASAGPPPRAPPPLFLPEGRRAQGSAARQGPRQCRHARRLAREARQADFWTRSWECFLLVGSLSPLSHRHPGPPVPRRDSPEAPWGGHAQLQSTAPTTALAVGRHGLQPRLG